MAVTQTVNNSLVAKQQAQVSFSSFVSTDSMKNKIANMLGGNTKSTERFISGVISAVSTNPALQECENATILSAALLGESLKLSPSPQLGYYYIVPFKDTKNGRTVATFQLGWKSYLQLAMRTGQYQKINAIEIKEGELVKYDPLEEEYEFKMIENDKERVAAQTVGYYAFFKLNNGFTKKLYWSKEKMEEHAKEYSQAYKNDLKKGWTMSFWSKDFDAMAKKTMLRQLLSKYGIMSAEMENAYQADMAASNMNGDKLYVDNYKDEDRFIATNDEILIDIENKEEVPTYTVDETTGEITLEK